MENLRIGPASYPQGTSLPEPSHTSATPAATLHKQQERQQPDLPTALHTGGTLARLQNMIDMASRPASGLIASYVKQIDGHLNNIRGQEEQNLQPDVEDGPYLPLLAAAENARRPDMNLKTFAHTADFLQHLQELKQVQQDGTPTRQRAIVGVDDGASYNTHYVAFDIYVKKNPGSEPQLSIVGFDSMGAGYGVDDLLKYLPHVPTLVDSALIIPTQTQKSDSGCPIFSKTNAVTMYQEQAKLGEMHERQLAKDNIPEAVLAPQPFRKEKLPIYSVTDADAMRLVPIRTFKLSQSLTQLDALPAERKSETFGRKQQTVVDYAMNHRGIRQFFSMRTQSETQKKISTALEHERKKTYQYAKNVFLSGLSNKPDSNALLKEKIESAAPGITLNWDLQLPKTAALIPDFDVGKGLRQIDAALATLSPEAAKSVADELLTAMPGWSKRSEIVQGFSLLQQLVLKVPEQQVAEVFRNLPGCLSQLVAKGGIGASDDVIKQSLLLLLAVQQDAEGDASAPFARSVSQLVALLAAILDVTTQEAAMQSLLTAAVHAEELPMVIDVMLNEWSDSADVQQEVAEKMFGMLKKMASEVSPDVLDEALSTLATILPNAKLA